jgi:hypothetical protein
MSKQENELEVKGITAGKLSKHVLINLKDLAVSTGITRQNLSHLFNQDREAFDDLLVAEMKKQLAIDIETEIAAIRTRTQIKNDLTAQMRQRIEEIKAMK